ncbi:MAG TPA: zinc ribbon domain-containing protein [Candidatus Bathyarchaeia archaeon]|nr:zinc ribbon domain-containing protein [Candidatus Bathyarchaeia archaeon]
MKKWLIVFGIILIALGTSIYFVLTPITSSQTIASEDSLTILAGSSFPRSFHIPSDASVSGTINQVKGQVTDDIDFYIFSRANYEKWVSNKDDSSIVWYIKIYRATSNIPFTFRTDMDDDYYFVFDNPGVWLNGERTVVWSASYDYKPYASYALLLFFLLVVLGALLICAAFLNELRQRIERYRICPNCGKKVEIKNTFCPHCGFDVSKSIRCKYCNTIYDRSLPKCPNCGAKNK